VLSKHSQGTAQLRMIEGDIAISIPAELPARAPTTCSIMRHLGQCRGQSTIRSGRTP
jgi:hypothetical protein